MKEKKQTNVPVVYPLKQPRLKAGKSTLLASKKRARIIWYPNW